MQLTKAANDGWMDGRLSVWSLQVFTSPWQWYPMSVKFRGRTEERFYSKFDIELCKLSSGGDRAYILPSLQSPHLTVCSPWTPVCRCDQRTKKADCVLWLLSETLRRSKGLITVLENRSNQNFPAVSRCSHVTSISKEWMNVWTLRSWIIPPHSRDVRK